MIFLAATLIAALLTAAAFPPLEWGFLVFLAPAPFLWSLRRVKLPRQALGLGFLYGTVTFGILLFWIWGLGVIAWVALVLGFAVYSSLYGVVVWWARTMRAWQWWIVAVGGWALLEFARARTPFSGFPWGSLGYAIGVMPWPRGAAQWIGASGWGVLAAAVAAGIVLFIEAPHYHPFMTYPLAAVVVASGFGAVLAPSADGPTWTVAVVQGNTPCPRVHCDREKELIFNSHLSLTSDIQPGTADMVVWGENSFGGSFEPINNPEVAVALAEQAARLDAYLMVSGTRTVSDTEFVNSNLVFDPEGEFVGEYLKRHPVPYGEHVYFREYLEWIPQLEQVPRDMVRGPAPGVFPVDVIDDTGVATAKTLGSVISFEGAFARHARDTVRAGAQLLTVNTNEASFGNTPASDQLIGITRMSAAENGVAIIHAAISGKSTFVDADGSVGPKTGLYEEAILFGEVRWRDGGRTLYSRVGDWLQVLAIVALVVPAAMWRPRRRQAEYLWAPPSRSMSRQR